MWKSTINNRKSKPSQYMYLYMYTYVFWFNPPFSVFFNWDSLHTRLNCHYNDWSYKKKKHKKIKAYRKSVWKEPTAKKCLLILDLKPFRSQVKGKHSIGREFQSLTVRGKKLLTQTSFPGFIQAILISGRWHKKLNILIEFSISIFIKFCFKAYCH